MPAQKNSRLDSSNWTPGKVTLLNALGLGKWNVKWPKFEPKFTTAVTAQAATTQAQLVAAGGPGPGTGTTGGGGGTTPGKTGTPPSVPGGVYSKAQLEQLWISAGGNPAKANIAAAIALAESGGRVNATDHDSNGSTDKGLWQINTVHGSLSTYNPQANARSAVIISANGSNWSPWVTFNSGAYRAFL